MPDAPSPADPAVAALVARHGLEPHPEGGWYRRVWTDEVVVDPGTGRRAGSAILYLLGPGQTSRWHRVLDADERWELVEGGPVVLELSPDGDAHRRVDLRRHDPRDHLVPAGTWQRAHTPDGLALCRCTVTPEFTFEGFELAAEGWRPTSQHAP